MGVWDKYETRIGLVGPTKRSSAYKREIREFKNKNLDSLSYHHVTVDGVFQDVMIMSSKNLNEKRITSMPGEKIKLGGLVWWMDNYWLVTEKDADTTVYEKATMEQCNHILKWITDDGVIHEQWCIISDGTKLTRTLYAQRFGMLETVCKNYLLNCWDTLRALLPKQNSEQLYMAMV